MRIGVDIGGTKIVAGLVSEDGQVLRSRRITTKTEKGYEGIRDDIFLLLRSVMEEAPMDGTVDRIGIATAGQIEKKTRRVLFSPNMGWHDAPLRDDVERAFGIETVIENDVNAAAYGEWRFSFNSAPESLLAVYVGTGVGGGFVVDGKVYRGFSGVGAEAGHTILNPYGYRCNCGNKGCFEAYCGGAYIVGRVRAAMDEGYRGKIWDCIGGDMANLHTGNIEKAYLLQDELCRSLWQEVIEYLGAGLASLINLLNPEVLVLGGGVINSANYLLGRAREILAERAMAASLKGMRIEKARLGEEAALLGAVYIDGK